MNCRDLILRLVLDGHVTFQRQSWFLSLDHAWPSVTGENWKPLSLHGDEKLSTSCGHRFRVHQVRKQWQRVKAGQQRRTIRNHARAPEESRTSSVGCCKDHTTSIISNVTLNSQMRGLSGWFLVKKKKKVSFSLISGNNILFLKNFFCQRVVTVRGKAVTGNCCFS